jgi:hypothetical protein
MQGIFKIQVSKSSFKTHGSTVSKSILTIFKIQVSSVEDPDPNPDPDLPDPHVCGPPGNGILGRLHDGSLLPADFKENHTHTLLRFYKSSQKNPRNKKTRAYS